MLRLGRKKGGKREKTRIRKVLSFFSSFSIKSKELAWANIMHGMKRNKHEIKLISLIIIKKILERLFLKDVWYMLLKLLFLYVDKNK